MKKMKRIIFLILFLCLATTCLVYADNTNIYKRWDIYLGVGPINVHEEKVTFYKDGRQTIFSQDTVDLLPTSSYSFTVTQYPNGMIFGSYSIPNWISESLLGNVSGNTTVFKINYYAKNDNIHDDWSLQKYEDKVTQNFSGTISGNAITGTFGGSYYEKWEVDYKKPDANQVVKTITTTTGTISGTFHVDILNYYPGDLHTTIISGPQGNNNAPNVTFVWKGSGGSGGISGYYYQLDFQQLPVYTTNTSVTFNNLNSSQHTFSVAAVDGAGNIDPAPPLRIFSVDGVTPPNPSQASQFGQPAQPGNPAVVGDPINSVTGNMFSITPDLTLPGKGLNFSFTRTYNSRSTDSGPLGCGWTHSYNVYLNQDATKQLVSIKDEQAREFLFADNGDGTYVNQRGEHSTLIKNQTNFTWTKKDGKQYLFDAEGKLTQIKDRNGNAITLTYNTQKQPVQITDTAGRKINFTYDGQGRIIQLGDPAGRSVYYSYDKDSNLIEVADPAGNKTRYDYDTNHNLTRKTDTLGKVTYFAYDLSDRCTSSSGEGNLIRADLTFDDVNKKTTVTDSKGNKAAYYYNNDYMITKIVDAQGGQITNTWDQDLNLTSVADQQGRVTNMQYDAKANLIKSTDPQGNITVYTYEPNFNLIQTITDAQGNSVTNTYDVKGNLTKTVDPMAGSYSYTYNASGQLAGMVDPLGKTVSYTYDAQGNLTQVKDAAGGVVTNTYDGIANLLTTKDQLGNTTQFTYDVLNRLTKNTYADNSTTTYGYDASGNRTSITDQFGKTTYFSYDQNGKVLSSTDPLNHVISCVFDTEENLVCVTDQNNSKTTFEYDTLNRRTAEIDALGNKTKYTYDAVGNRISVTDPKGQTTKYEYDNLNRLVKITNPDSTTITYVYDSLGRRTSLTDSSGATTYVYDKLGRLLKVDGPLAKDTITYTYDAMGNRLTIIDPDGLTTKYAYDALNRISSITDSQNKVTTYVFDLNGNLTTLIYPNGTKALYSYDKLNHLVTLTNLKTAAPSTKLSEYTYTYDLAGRKTKAALLDGSTISYAYDAIGQLTQEINNSTTQPYSYAYTYDLAGNRTRKTVDNGDYNYSYNSLNQLTQEDTRLTSSSGPKKIIVTGTVSDLGSGVKSITVNGVTATLVGNTLSVQIPLSLGKNTITVIAADVLGNTTTKVIHVTYEPGIITTQTKYIYDRNGNLITKEEQGQTTSLAYDSQNRLKTFTNPASSATYAYDGQGRRISKTVNGSTTSYIYDNDELIREQTGSSVISYIHGSRIDEIISDSRGYYYHYDGLGSVTNLTNTTGAQVNSYNYEAFGNLTNQTGITSNPWLFTGRQYDQESGLYFYRNRYYDPTIGRFISQDPTGMVDGPNLYAYVKNNPVNLIDPLGLCWKKIYDAVALVQARIELFLNKGLHFPVHLLAEITDAYGPMDTPVTFFLNRYNPTQPLVNLLAEQTLSPLDIALENSIIAWENHIAYLEGKK